MKSIAQGLWASLRGLSRTSPGRKSWRSRLPLAVEQLGERIVPAATPLVWTGHGDATSWGDKNNWDRVNLPDVNHEAILQGTGTIKIGNTVPAANLNVAGLDTTDPAIPANHFSGILDLNNPRKVLTIFGNSADSATGLKWDWSATLRTDTTTDGVKIVGGQFGRVHSQKVASFWA